MHHYTIYKDLGNPSLLRRCLKGATQNPNESLHSMVWIKCHKVKFSGIKNSLSNIQQDHTFGYNGAIIVMHLLSNETRLQETPCWMDKESQGEGRGLPIWGSSDRIGLYWGRWHLPTTLPLND